jgi:hypothetical protein
MMKNTTEKKPTMTLKSLLDNMLERVNLFIYFIYDLLDDAVSNSDYIVSNDRVLSKSWIEKDMEGSHRGLI